MSYQQITPLEDPILRQLVNYVADYLNQKWQTEIIVRHTEIYDSYNNPNDSYPLLKIYRKYTTGNLNNSQRNSEIAIAYCLLNTQIVQTPAITNWIDISIREALRQFTINHPNLFDIENNISCSYKTVMQLGEIVYQIEFNLSLNNESNTACNVLPPYSTSTN